MFKPITVWIQVGPDKNVGPDLGSSCLQKLSAEDSGRQRHG